MLSWFDVGKSRVEAVDELEAGDKARTVVEYNIDDEWLVDF